MTMEQGMSQPVNQKHEETFRMLAELSSNNFQTITKEEKTNYKQTKLNS